MISTVRPKNLNVTAHLEFLAINSPELCLKFWKYFGNDTGTVTEFLMPENNQGFGTGN